MSSFATAAMTFAMVAVLQVSSQYDNMKIMMIDDMMMEDVDMTWLPFDDML